MFAHLPDRESNGTLEVVSGGAKGVDSLAESETMGWTYLPEVTFRKFLPAHQSWNGGNGLPGYKVRNMQITEYCDELICIRSQESCTFGSGWTANYAEQIGKPVKRIYV